MPINSTLIFETILLIAGVSIAVFLYLKYATRANPKNNSNKLMLKKLLQHFDLDIPEELNDIESEVIKPIKP